MTGDLQPAGNSHQHVVVMGVAGCGKSTVGQALAERIGAAFIDGDSLHPSSNIAKMSSGIPLNDADRTPWLQEIGRRFMEASASDLVIACSALKYSYRQIIREQDPSVLFVHLDGSRDLLFERMKSRPGHFMPPALLDSQLATLEPLRAGERGLVVDIALEVPAIVDSVLEWLESGALESRAERAVFAEAVRQQPFHGP
ncbi:gluconokinase [Arthrobacter sp. ISL-30]|uniref:gluconokinase n=1 Tax=Arthrobacter sp. ISL-30 TaxID=2819109 RepID=UPI002035095B|nr:gluconokinase [Arthrobacter sp. ISL-30]